MSAEAIEGVVLDQMPWGRVLNDHWGAGSTVFRLGMLHEPEIVVRKRSHPHLYGAHPAPQLVCKGHEAADFWMRWPCADARLLLETMGMEAREILVE